MLGDEDIVEDLLLNGSPIDSFDKVGIVNFGI